MGRHRDASNVCVRASSPEPQVAVTLPPNSPSGVMVSSLTSSQSGNRGSSERASRTSRAALTIAREEGWSESAESTPAMRTTRSLLSPSSAVTVSTCICGSTKVPTRLNTTVSTLDSTRSALPSRTSTPFRTAASMPCRMASAGEMAKLNGATTIKMASAVDAAVLMLPVNSSQRPKSSTAMAYAAGMSMPAERVETMVAAFCWRNASSSHRCTAVSSVVWPTRVARIFISPSRTTEPATTRLPTFNCGLSWVLINSQPMAPEPPTTSPSTGTTWPARTMTSSPRVISVAGRCSKAPLFALWHTSYNDSAPGRRASSSSSRFERTRMEKYRPSNNSVVTVQATSR